MSILELLKKIFKRIKWFLIVDLREFTNSFYASSRRNKLKGTDFTILSNNCWGGHVYRYFGLPYQSPTVGLYFFPEEYLRFCSNYKYYLSLPLEILNSYQDSKYYKELETRGEVNVPIAKLGDVEMVMLHYHSKEEAIEKWNRRVSKVNFDKILIKNSFQNGMTDEQVVRFDSLTHAHKFIFTSKHYPKVESEIIYKKFLNKGQILDDVSYFIKYLDIVEILNDMYK